LSAGSGRFGGSDFPVLLLKVVALLQELLNGLLKLLDVSGVSIATQLFTKLLLKLRDTGHHLLHDLKMLQLELLDEL